jgi:hypothetical protein
MSRQDTPATVRAMLARVRERKAARVPLTYAVGDTVPEPVIAGAWEMATEVLCRKHRR